MNNIFKYMVTGLLAILPASLVAQNTALLDALYESFASHCILLDCEYSVVSQGVPSKGDCKVEVQGTVGGHGGGDTRMLDEMFGKDVAPDPLKRAASHIDGAYSIMTGICANKSKNNTSSNIIN